MEDEWDNDVLHVTYNANQSTMRRMLKAIDEQGFEAEIKPVEDESGPE